MKDNDIDNESLDKLLGEANIDDIVDKGVRKKVPFIKYLIDTIKTIGLKNIFHDKVELAVIISSVILLFMISFVIADNHKYSLYKSAFIMSPIIYGCVVFFSFYNSMEKGAFELEMTSKYNFCQVASLRMFIFSILSMLLNTVVIFILWLSGGGIDLLRTIIISASGLFFFSAVFLYLLTKVRWRLSKYFIAFWIAMNVIVSGFADEMYIEFLLKVPLVVHFVISAVCAVLYVRNLNVLINHRRKKGEI